MISINEFRISLLNLANKWRSGTLPPSRMNDFLQQSSIELFNEKYLAAVQNNKLDDDLAPFLKSQNLPVTAPEGLNFGLVERPTTEYNYFWSMRCFFSGTIEQPVSCGCPTSDNSACDARKNLVQISIPTELLPIIKEKRVTKVSDGVWDSVLNHRTKFPSLSNPYTTQYAGGFKIAPRNLNTITLDAYRLPVTAVFGYITVPNAVTGVPYYQYNPTTSVDIEWPSQVKDELLDRALKLFAIYIGNPLLYQQADNLKQTRI